MAVRHWQIASQELLTDPDCAPESAMSILFQLLGLLTCARRGN